MEAGTSSFILGLLLYLDLLDTSLDKVPIPPFIWMYMNTTIVLWCSSIPFEPFERFVLNANRPSNPNKQL